MKAYWCLCFTFALSGCGNNTSGPVATIPLAVVLDRTGSVASPSWGDAVNQAITDANAGLKMASRNVQFNGLIADSTNTPAVAIMRATDLVQNQGAKAIIADTSQDDIALNQLAYANPSMGLNVPIVCQAC